MLPDAFIARYRVYLTEKTEVPQFMADLQALLDWAAAGARREALEEAEATCRAAFFTYGSNNIPEGNSALNALHALPRWDGTTPFGSGTSKLPPKPESWSGFPLGDQTIAFQPIEGPMGDCPDCHNSGFTGPHDYDGMCNFCGGMSASLGGMPVKVGGIPRKVS